MINKATHRITPYLRWSPVVGLAFWGLEQAVSNEPWVPSLGSHVFISAIFFYFGSELSSPNSTLKRRYSQLRGFGSFGGLVVKPCFKSYDEDHGGEWSGTSILLPFVFRKKCNVDAIKIKARILKYHPKQLDHFLNSEGKYEWHLSRDTQFQKDEKIDIPIAHIPDKIGLPGLYGDEDMRGYRISDGSAHYIEVTILAGTNKMQSEEVQIFLPSNRPSNSVRLGKDPGKRFMVFQNGELPSAP